MLTLRIQQTGQHVRKTILVRGNEIKDVELRRERRLHCRIGLLVQLQPVIRIAKTTLSRNHAVGMGIATVPVAAIGVPPMAPAREGVTPFGAPTARSLWSAGRRPVRARRARSPKRTASFRLSQCPDSTAKPHDSITSEWNDLKTARRANARTLPQEDLPTPASR